jgi:hypothetical protein
LEVIKVIEKSPFGGHFVLIEAFTLHNWFAVSVGKVFVLFVLLWVFKPLLFPCASTYIVNIMKQNEYSFWFSRFMETHSHFHIHRVFQ